MTFTEEAIENYCLSKSSKPSAVCDELYQYTVKNVPMAQMLTGPLVGSVLGFLLEVVSAKRVLEVGCFTGYSALAMAERLPSGGEVITLDIDPDTAKIAKEFWKKSRHGGKITHILGPALESLKDIKGPFDFVLIDADKSNYLNYLNRALELISPKGMIVVDNCLWSGRVLEKAADENTKAIQELNDSLSKRTDLVKTLIPVRDGLFFIRKKD